MTILSILYPSYIHPNTSYIHPISIHIHSIYIHIHSYPSYIHPISIHIHPISIHIHPIPINPPSIHPPSISHPVYASTATLPPGEVLQCGPPRAGVHQTRSGEGARPSPAKEPESLVRTDDFLFNDASLVPRRGLEQVQIAPNRKKN